MTTALPREIRKAIRKKRAKRIFLFLSATILTAVIIAIWGEYDISFSRRLYCIKILMLRSASDFTVFLYKSLPDFYRF